MTRSIFRLGLSVALAVGLTFSLGGCKKGNRQEKQRFKLHMTDEVKNIPLSQLLPKNTVKTGKRIAEVDDKIKSDYMYGTLAGQYGKYPTAVKYLTAALAREPKLVDAHHNLGLAYYKMGRVDDAVREWSHTLRLDPSYDETYYNIAIFLLDNGRRADAEKALTRCIQANQFHLKARFALGKLAQQEGKNQEAIRHFRAYQMRDRGDLKVHLALGELYLLENQVDASLRDRKSVV